MRNQRRAHQIGTTGASGIRSVTKTTSLLELSAAAIDGGALFGSGLGRALRLGVETEGHEKKYRAKNEESRQDSHMFRIESNAGEEIRNIGENG